VASYRRNLRVHVVPRIFGIRLQALTPLHLDTMYADLLGGGNMRTEGTALSARTVRYVHSIVRKALSDATRKDSSSATRRMSRRHRRRTVDDIRT